MFVLKKKEYSFALQIYIKVYKGGIPERSNGTDCKSVASASQVRILLPPL